MQTDLQMSYFGSDGLPNVLVLMIFNVQSNIYIVIIAIIIYLYIKKCLQRLSTNNYQSIDIFIHDIYRIGTVYIYKWPFAFMNMT